MTFWIRVASGLYLGDTLRPYRDEFDSVITVSDEPPVTDDGLRHRHLAPPKRPVEVHPFLDTARRALLGRWMAGKTLLIQSPGYSWAEVLIAEAFIHLGANADEAIGAVRLARRDALAEQHFLDLLRAREVTHAACSSSRAVDVRSTHGAPDRVDPRRPG